MMCYHQAKFRQFDFTFPENMNCLLNIQCSFRSPQGPLLAGQGRLGINWRSVEAHGDFWRKAAGRWQAELGA